MEAAVGADGAHRQRRGVQQELASFEPRIEYVLMWRGPGAFLEAFGEIVFVDTEHRREGIQ